MILNGFTLNRNDFVNIWNLIYRHFLRHDKADLSILFILLDETGTPGIIHRRIVNHMHRTKFELGTFGSGERQRADDITALPSRTASVISHLNFHAAGC